MNQYHRKFPVYRDATRLVTEIEQAVQVFPRYHKYTLGSEMRRTAYHFYWRLLWPLMMWRRVIPK